MNTTTIPCFTAEASLDRISMPYRWAVNGFSMADSGSIVPQRIKLRDWTCECDARRISASAHQEARCA